MQHYEQTKPSANGFEYSPQYFELESYCYFSHTVT